MTETDRTGQAEDRKQPREQILTCITTAGRIRNFTEPQSSEDLSHHPAKPFAPRRAAALTAEAKVSPGPSVASSFPSTAHLPLVYCIVIFIEM